MSYLLVVADEPTPRETIALLEATLDATHDGILVLDLNRRVIRCNRRFQEMFGVTADMIERQGIDRVMASVAPQLEGAEALIQKSQTISSDADAEIYDVLRFKDGRVIERFVAPHRIGSKSVGLVATFHDVS